MTKTLTGGCCCGEVSYKVADAGMTNKQMNGVY